MCVYICDRKTIYRVFFKASASGNSRAKWDVGSETKSFDYLKYRVFYRVSKVTESDYVNDMAEYALTMG